MPVNDENFCGVYLKANRQQFRPLRNEFNLAQTSQRQLIQSPDPAEVDALVEENLRNWNTLSDSLVKVFTTDTRDIELVGWIMAAQVIIDPTLEGTKQTSSWLKTLVVEHWDSLHPILPDNKIKADSDDEKINEINAFKVKSFVQLVGESEESSLLYSPLLLQPLIGDLDYSRYLSEERKGNLPELRQQYHSVVMEERALITERVQNLVELKANFSAIDSYVAGLCKQSLLPAPGFQFVITLLSKLLRAIEFLSGIKPAITAEAQPEPDLSVSPEGELSSTAPPASPEPMGQSAMQPQQHVVETVSFTTIAEQQDFNRDQAFHQLRELAEFFKKTEPHSPVSYLLEKAIRWGYMPLPDLMTELLSNQQETINRVFNLSGLDEVGQTNLPELNRARTAGLTHKTAEPAIEVNDTQPVDLSSSLEEERTHQQELQKEQKSNSSSNSLW
ncbi:type VI secretion system ImpA family N-terminal domain-containing protein [uncultured Photobacterium sp.]|uniref:type VI secretion system protein TssA n=1 Tax=uncultured Photobacterium sp. TaxID=173973 RepID=UPI00262C95F8|nr:type VI secretion system ImpA family N-terminal domain-containing protein [uncultured Photobacterium sp.]